VLEDPRTYGQNACIVDPWVFGNKVMTPAQLRDDPVNNAVYGYKHWIGWHSFTWSPTLPESLKDDTYDNYPEYRQYFDYCQDKIDEMLQIQR
jgi:hypothetical protein